jgi:hypothetical protein
MDRRYGDEQYQMRELVSEWRKLTRECKRDNPDLQRDEVLLIVAVALVERVVSHAASDVTATLGSGRDEEQ